MATASYFLNEAEKPFKILAVQGRQQVRPGFSRWVFKEIWAYHGAVCLFCTNHNEGRQTVDVSCGKVAKRERYSSLSHLPEFLNFCCGNMPLVWKDSGQCRRQAQEQTNGLSLSSRHTLTVLTQSKTCFLVWNTSNKLNNFLTHSPACGALKRLSSFFLFSLSEFPPSLRSLITSVSILKQTGFLSLTSRLFGGVYCKA